MNNKFLSILFLVIILLTLSNCVTIYKEEHIPSNDTFEKKVCILYHHSKFRNKIAKELAEKFNKLNIAVIIDDAFKKKDHPPEEYDLVIVFSGIHTFIPDAYPRNYVWKHRRKKNIIHVFCTFLTTKGISVTLDRKKRVDTITAASVPDNIKELTDKIFEISLSKLGM